MFPSVNEKPFTCTPQLIVKESFNQTLLMMLMCAHDLICIMLTSPSH